MKNFFIKIARFFWSLGFLKFILGMVAFIILFYVEEDWRGARAWAATKAEWEAKGETFDYNKFIPPPVPDDQNLAAIPLFKLGPMKYDDGTSYIGLVNLKRAMRTDPPGNNLPTTGNWEKGKLPDMTKIQEVIAANYAAVFKGAIPPQDILAQFDALYPFLSDLRAAAATRPFFRLKLDYTISPPVSRPLSPLTAPIKLAQILTLHAVLALDHHESNIALEDIETNYKILSGVKRDPTLVAGLVAIGMITINNEALSDGLAQHEWSDNQLVEIGHILAPINSLADNQFSMRSEAASWGANIDYFEKAGARSTFRGLFQVGMNSNAPLMIRFAPPWPDGWWDQNKSQLAMFLFRSVADVDPKTRLVFPKLNLALQHQVEEASSRFDANAPWNILFLIAAGPLGNATLNYARAQVWVDEARIACALERYRLAQGVLPGSLDALAPAYIDELPHDIMNGQPYHYQLRADGTYLLYSVGWNQTDDGGKIVCKKDNPLRVDYDQGDWVWPTPK